MTAPKPSGPALIADYVRLTLWRDRTTKGLQLAIESDSDPGGYRIFGPSFIGDSERLVTHRLEQSGRSRNPPLPGAHRCLRTSPGTPKQ